MNMPPGGSPLRFSAIADRLFGWAAKGAALVTLGLLAAILVSLLVGAWPAIEKYGLGFLTNSVWDPVREEFGGHVMIHAAIVIGAAELLMMRRSIYPLWPSPAAAAT